MSSEYQSSWNSNSCSAHPSTSWTIQTPTGWLHHPSPMSGYMGCVRGGWNFSHWIEAYPTKTSTAMHTAKSLLKDLFRHCGMPEWIHSDCRTHFTGQVVQEVMKLLNVQWKLHCPHRPQASGQVEHQNQTLKHWLSKFHQSGVSWVDALPAVLCSIRSTPTRSVSLGPSVIIMGKLMSLLGTINLRQADVHLTSDVLLKYC